MRPIISVHQLSKVYRLGGRHQSADTIVGAIRSIATAPVRNLRELTRLNTFGHTIGDEGDSSQHTIWALKDVGFEIGEGEVVGVIGRNGAGKSTLLKVLSRITEPTAGRVEIHGRVSSLLEVGTGFHPELTGRDNVYMNGTILGMTKREIDQKFDEIVDFSGVERFLDTPIKRYSSGMQVRLAFAVAAHLEPEILIVDEVLAVGDQEFQNRCMGKMKNVASSGRTVLFVSHNMTAVANLCERAIIMSDGRMQADGPTRDVIEEYLSSACSGLKESFVRPSDSAPESPLRIETVDVELTGDQPNLRLRLMIGLRSLAKHPPAQIAIDFFNPSGGWVMQAVPNLEPIVSYRPNGTSFECIVELPPLIPGKYGVGVWVGHDLSVTLDEVREAVGIEIVDSPTVGRTMSHTSARGYVVPKSSIHETPPGIETVAATP